MTKEQTQAQAVDTNTTGNAATQASGTPGQQLRAAREALGMSQQQVADRLHLRLNNIQAVETDTHEKGVSITFTKGYVRIYAKLVGLPSQPLLDAFDVLHSDEKTPAKLQSFSRRVSKEANDERWMMVTYLMLFLVVASVVIWWFQQSDKSIGARFNELSDGVVEQVKSLGGETSGKLNTDLQQGIEGKSEAPVTEVLETTEVAIPQATQIEEPSALNNNVAELQSTALNAIEQGQIELQANADNAAATIGSPMQISNANETKLNDTDVANAQTSSNELAAQGQQKLADLEQEVSDNLGESINELVGTIAQATNYEVNADGTVDVVFTFKDDCWVSVKDGDGGTMAYGVKTKGRVMRVSGVAPVRVILGAPQNVDINFGGQDVDMSVYEPGRSANFALPVEGE